MIEDALSDEEELAQKNCLTVNAVGVERLSSSTVRNWRWRCVRVVTSECWRSFCERSRCMSLTAMRAIGEVAGLVVSALD